MSYARIENGIISVTTKPSWFNNLGQPLTDEDLRSHGYYPVVDEKPQIDPSRQVLHRNEVSLWNIESERVVITYYVTELSTDAIRQSTLRAITDKRWAIETGGLTLPNGVRVKTGVDDQNRITSVIANATLAGVESVDFKSDDGWVTLSLVEISQVAAAIASHVQSCFSAERTHHEAVEAIEASESGTVIDKVLAYDINTGWPE